MRESTNGREPVPMIRVITITASIYATFNVVLMYAYAVNLLGPMPFALNFLLIAVSVVGVFASGVLLAAGGRQTLCSPAAWYMLCLFGLLCCFNVRCLFSAAAAY